MSKVRRGDAGVVIYDHPNREMKSFLLGLDIFPPRVVKFKKPLDKPQENSLESLGVIGSIIVREIMKMPGVKEIYVKPKEIRLTKETSCGWEQLEKPVVEILERGLRRKNIKIVRK